jgi:protein PhnA
MGCGMCGAEPAAAEHRVEQVGAFPVCATCAAQLGGDPADVEHWQCLHAAVWSEVPAVQVAAWRMAGRLGTDWGRELQASGALSDGLLAVARAEVAPEVAARVVDANGATLADGDSVTLIKDLEVKGGGFTAKRGTLVKGIRLTDDPGLVEGRVNKMAIYLKTEFLKKA